jgi:hypothetical protein
MILSPFWGIVLGFCVVCCLITSLDLSTFFFFFSSCEWIREAATVATTPDKNGFTHAVFDLIVGRASKVDLVKDTAFGYKEILC